MRDDEDKLETRDTDPAPPMTERGSSLPSELGESFAPISSLSDEEVARELLSLISPTELRVERRVLLYLARRFCVLGLRCYGPAALEDERDNVLEATAEAADLLFYLGREAVRRGG